MTATALPDSSDQAPSCEIIPVTGVRGGPGWYLVGANNVTEAGPFTSEGEADTCAAWMDDQGLGVNPSPWRPVYASRGLRIGVRYRQRR